MNARASLRSLPLAVVLVFSLLSNSVARVDDALSFAYECADPYVKEGFTVREDTWAGDLGEGDAKAVLHQLFKGNDYWFWMGTDTEKASISVHVYDTNGKLVETESWQRRNFAAARISPPRTGSYYVVVKIEKSPADRTHWGLVYGYK